MTGVSVFQNGLVDTLGAQPIGTRVYYIGDSITQKGMSDSNADGTGATVFAPLLQGRAWYAHAMMLSEGRLLYAGQGATGGFTTQQIKDTHLSGALNSSARMICVLGGRNDVVNGVAADITIRNLRDMYLGIAASGRIPICCTLTANSGNTTTQSFSSGRINAFIRTIAMLNNWPLVDFEAATTDAATGGQKAGMFVDASHPNAGLGARTMGAEFYNKLSSYLTPHKPLHALTVTTPTTSNNAFVNPLNTTLVGAAGTAPTNWTNAGAGTGTRTTYDPSTTGNDALGLWCRVARTSGTGAVQFYSDKVAVSPGDTVACSFRLKTSVEAVGAWAAFRLIGNTNSGDVPTSVVQQYVAGVNTWNGDILTPGLYYQQNVIDPAVNFVSFVASLSLGSAAAANVDFSQVGVFNLTQLGVLS